MEDRGWTIQVLPDDGREEPRTLRVSRSWVRWGAVVAVLLVAGGVGLGLSLGWGAWQQANLEELRAENRVLRSRVDAADRTVNRLAGELNRMAVQEERFRILAGLPLVDDEIRQVGVGGPGPAVRTAAAPGPGGAGGGAGSARERDLALPQLLRRADLLHASLREAADSMAANRRLFLSRPSIRPVADEVSWISSSYSRSRYHPVLHVNRPHEGIDVSAPHGAPIRATANGRVVETGERAGYGKIVEIGHGHGYRTLYGHASEITVQRGERVERGDVIARVGETGLTSGPNVHYEVHVDGRPVNPGRFLVDDRVPQ